MYIAVVLVGLFIPLEALRKTRYCSHASNSATSCSVFSSKNWQTAAASGRSADSMDQHVLKRSQRRETVLAQFLGRTAGGFPLSIADIILKLGLGILSEMLAYGGFP